MFKKSACGGLSKIMYFGQQKARENAEHMILLFGREALAPEIGSRFRGCAPKTKTQQKNNKPDTKPRPKENPRTLAPRFHPGASAGGEISAPRFWDLLLGWVGSGFIISCICFRSALRPRPTQTQPNPKVNPKISAPRFSPQR